jgi:uncharacterized protein GlcG (DUF336 family)
MLGTKKFLTLAAVKQIAAAAEQEAVKNNWNVVITIVDDGGNTLFVERMDNAQLGSVDVSLQKARASVLFKRPTKALEEVVSGGRTVMMSLKNLVPVEGGLPLLDGERIIGAIGVSGVTSPQDAQIARAGVEELARILKA